MSVYDSLVHVPEPGVKSKEYSYTLGFSVFPPDGQIYVRGCSAKTGTWGDDPNPVVADSAPATPEQIEILKKYLVEVSEQKDMMGCPSWVHWRHARQWGLRQCAIKLGMPTLFRVA